MRLRKIFRASLPVLVATSIRCSPPGTAAPDASTSATLSATAAASSAASADPASTPPAPTVTAGAPSAESLDRATPTLPSPLLAALAGCWATDTSDERWQLDRSGASGLTVTRHVDTDEPDYARRVKIPTPLLYNAAQGTFGFTAAGHIHELLFVFMRVDDTLAVDSYSRREPRAPFHATGSRFTLHRCAPHPIARPPHDPE